KATEHGGRAGQEVRRTASGHETRRASANAKAAALGSLHQNDANERDGDECLDDQQEGEHVELSRKEDARRDLVGAAHPFNCGYLPAVAEAAPLTSASSCSAV